MSQYRSSATRSSAMAHRATVVSTCAVLTAILVLSACGGELSIDLPPPDAAPDAAPPPVVPVVRVLSWPGAGLQLAVEAPEEVVAESGGQPPEAWIEGPTGERIDAVAAPAGVSAGLTAVVVLPSADPTIHAARLAAADALLRALPPEERVALFAVRDHAELLAELALPHDHARERLAALAPGPAHSALVGLREVRELLVAAQSSYGALGRTAIVVGDTGADDPPEVLRVVAVLTMPVDERPDAAAAATVAQLVARRARIFRIGACPGFIENAPFTLHLGRGYARDLYAPAVMDHVAGEPCAAADAAADRYPYPAEIDLTFTPEERTIFDQVYAASNENMPFRTSVKLGTGGSIAATAHLRGSGTLFCQRKSLNVQLDGPRRRLMPGVAADRFFLISMCQDDYYFTQVFTDRLLTSLDLFSPHVRYVKLRIDGVNRGLYVLMDQPDNAIRDNALGIVSVIRRRYDIDNQPAEVKYPDDPMEAAATAARFETLGDRARYGPLENLDADLAARIDLDRYVRMLALYSLVQNGDYIDEPFFAGSLEAGAEYYHAKAWDTDDVFSLCHGGGGRAIMDRCGLSYCAEAELDYALLRSPATYERFLAALDDVLARITPAYMTATLDDVKAELWSVLDDDETATALVEIGSPNLMAARNAIAARMTAILDTARANHASLITRTGMCPRMP
jgi:hypothetical protein